MTKMRVFLPVFMLFFCFLTAQSQSKDTASKVAVLVVGHLEMNVDRAIDEMNRVGNFFTHHGYKVYKFYDRNARWDKIAKVAGDCDFFVYAGHGAAPEKKDIPGILCIDSMISSRELARKVTFRKKAVVINHTACYAAGSSASDEKDIGAAEASRRVQQYANAYFSVGASAYFANNFEGGMVNFLKSFFAGKTLSQSFTASCPKNVTLESEKPLPGDKAKTLAITSTSCGEIKTRLVYSFSENGTVEEIKEIPCSKSYDITYMGPPGLLLADLRQSR